MKLYKTVWVVYSADTENPVAAVAASTRKEAMHNEWCYEGDTVYKYQLVTKPKKTAKKTAKKPANQPAKKNVRSTRRA